MNTIFVTIVALSVLTGVATSASAYDQRTWQEVQVFSTGQGR
jgi:hypothetical protein